MPSNKLTTTDQEFLEAVSSSRGTLPARKEKPLKPWQYIFAEWLAHQVDRPPIQEQIDKAEELCQQAVSLRLLRQIKQRRQFIEYYAKLHADVITRARAKLEKDYDQYVDAHKVGLDIALNLGDYKAIPSYTTPILDRVAPKRADNVSLAAVNITLQPQQQRLLTSDAIEIECEVVQDDENVAK